VNTYAVQPVSPFVPVFHVAAFTASEVLSKALSIQPVHGIWIANQLPQPTLEEFSHGENISREDAGLAFAASANPSEDRTWA
jgi:hypothetical protein